MSWKDLCSALDVLNVRLAFETGTRLAPKEWERSGWSYIANVPMTSYVCEIWLTGGLVLEGPRWWATARSGSTARRLAWEDLLRTIGLPGVSSGEELELKLSLLSDRDVRDKLHLISKRRYA